MTTDEIRAMVNTLGGQLAILQQADSADKAEIYRNSASHSPTTKNGWPWPKPDQDHPWA